MLGTDAEGGVRRPAEIQRDPGCCCRPDRAVGAADLIELPVVVERLRLGQLAAEQTHELGGSRIAAVVVGEVAIPLLVQFVAAGYVVDGDPAAAGQLVQRGQLPCDQRRRHEPRPVSDQYLESGRAVEDVRGDRESVRAGRAVADEHPVEARVLVRLRELRQVSGVNRRTIEGAARLRHLLGADHADDLNGHCRRSSRRSGRPGVTHPVAWPRSPGGVPGRSDRHPLHANTNSGCLSINSIELLGLADAGNIVVGRPQPGTPPLRWSQPRIATAPAAWCGLMPGRLCAAPGGAVEVADPSLFRRTDLARRPPGAPRESMTRW